MMQEVLNAFTFEWRLVLVDFIRVAIAFVLALPIAHERASSARSVGLRTFPIVAIASCGYMLIAKDLAGSSADTMTRALQGLLGGIGFIGGGAILKENGSIYGLATAASLWNTGALGAAVAFGREEIALVLCLLNFMLLRLLTPVVSDEGYTGIATKAGTSSDAESADE